MSQPQMPSISTENLVCSSNQQQAAAETWQSSIWALSSRGTNFHNRSWQPQHLAQQRVLVWQAKEWINFLQSVWDQLNNAKCVSMNWATACWCLAGTGASASAAQLTFGGTAIAAISAELMYAKLFRYYSLIKSHHILALPVQKKARNNSSLI